MTNAVEPVWQNVKQEATNELVGAESHDALPVRTIAAIILVAKGDAGLVEGKQLPRPRVGQRHRRPREPPDA